MNYAIVRAKGPGTASLVTYVIPVFSTVLGVAVLGEALHWNQPVGTVVLLAGVAISQGRIARGQSARSQKASSVGLGARPAQP